MSTYSYNGNTTTHRQRKGRYWNKPPGKIRGMKKKYIRTASLKLSLIKQGAYESTSRYKLKNIRKEINKIKYNII
jgi:hypothetical protein